jgi:cytochrome c-type biogenesis protein CcmF
MRIDKLAPEGTIEEPKSREGVFLINNLLFVLFTFTVLIGTVFPLVVEAVQGVQMSVGRPYFDKMAIPIGVALLFLMGVGPALPWGRSSGPQLRKALLAPFVGAVVLGVVGYLLGARNPWTLLTLFFGGYTAQVTLQQFWWPVRQRMQSAGENPGEAFLQSQIVRGRRRFGAYIAHSGAVIIIIAIAVSSTMQESRQVQLRQGDTATIGAYTLTFTGAEVRDETHRQSTIANVAVSRNGKAMSPMSPRMNHYVTQREPIGTPDVKTTFTGDLYLSIMNIDPATQTVGLLMMINPMVGWIWIATGMMGLGGLVALIPTRRRREVMSMTPVSAGVSAGPGRPVGEAGS